MSLIPRRQPQTKLGAALRKLALEVEKDARDLDARKCRIAAANLDMAAISLGARGERVKQLGSYVSAAQVYAMVNGGVPYDG